MGPHHHSCQISIEILNGRWDIPEVAGVETNSIDTEAGCNGEPSKYRPIACLNSVYKVITATLAN